MRARSIDYAVAKAMHDKGYSYSELAALFDVSTQTIHRACNEEYRLREAVAASVRAKCNPKRRETWQAYEAKRKAARAVARQERV